RSRRYWWRIPGAFSCSRDGGRGDSAAPSVRVLEVLASPGRRSSGNWALLRRHVHGDVRRPTGAAVGRAQGGTERNAQSVSASPCAGGGADRVALCQNCDARGLWRSGRREPHDYPQVLTSFTVVPEPRKENGHEALLRPRSRPLSTRGCEPPTS